MLRWLLSNRTSGNCTEEMSVWMFMTKKLPSIHSRKSSRQTLLRPPTDSQPGCKAKASHYDLITHRETEREKQEEKTGVEILSELKHRRLN